MKIPLSPGPLSTSDILRALDHRIAPVDNWQAVLLGPIVTPGTPNTEFTVQHNLGRTPTNYIWNIDQNCVVYDSRRANWTDQQLFLKCSVASASLYLIVL